MNELRRLARIAVLGGALAAGALIPGTSAQASPTNCSDRYELHSYYVYCGRGDGEYRARVRCYKSNGSGDYVVRYGVWRRPGGEQSVASCTASEDPASGNWQFR